MRDFAMADPMQDLDDFLYWLPLGTTFTCDDVNVRVGEVAFSTKAISDKLRREAAEGHGRLEVVTVGAGGRSRTVYKKKKDERVTRQLGEEMES
jgi:hypothetical protein